ncbi:MULTISPECIES: hypothetical protein [Rhizobium]|uniref:hypothetical protein n=1 Tax=Rhizobium TaxID=379 RepID=UPI0011AB5FD7|nr:MULTISPECIES: hypothetical protein [Rhizobium]
MEERRSERDQDSAGARAAAMTRSAARRGFQIGRLCSKRLFAGASDREVAAGSLTVAIGAPGRAGFGHARGSPQNRIARAAPKAMISTASVTKWSQIPPAHEGGRIILNRFAKWLEFCWSGKRYIAELVEIFEEVWTLTSRSPTGGRGRRW